MHNQIRVTITPNAGGAEVELKNILSYTFTLHRDPGPNGRVGTTAHDIGYIHLTRRKSLEEGGLANLEGDTVVLAANIAKKAYFKGEITLARADDPTNVVQTVRWDEGHICDLSYDVRGNEIIENLAICVTTLKVNDSVFKRTSTN